MKKKFHIGQLLQYFIILLGVIGFLWAFFINSEEIQDKFLVSKEEISSFPTYMVIAALIAVVVAALLFIIGKIYDPMVHKKHLKELLFIIGIIAVAFIIGLIYSFVSDNVMTLDGQTHDTTWIGIGIVTAMVLGIVAFGALIYEMVSAIVKPNA